MFIFYVSVNACIVDFQIFRDGP
uniref:Uncharacterized protein n=1 Tax=Anguilla anguilla TaxID=7936 RepID=A0A0E9TSY4_ANGAN